MPLIGLDSDQRTAATASGSEVVISAGAGSGKTRLLVGRYLYLIKTESISLSEIVAITFTEKAASQMKAAIARKARELSSAYQEEHTEWETVASEIHNAPISTIHAFCNSILRSYPHEAGLDPLFIILDQTTLSELMSEAIDSFIMKRLESEPEKIDILIRAFGFSGLKRMFHTILRERTRLITLLDTFGIERPDSLERRYTGFLREELDKYLTMLKEFHSVAPGDDSLFPKLDDIVNGLSRVLVMCEEDDVDIDFVRQVIERIKSNQKRGSENKWSEKGISVSEIRDGIKECISFLELLYSFYLNERGVTAQVAALLLGEYELLDQHFLEMKKSRSCLDHDDTLIETWRLLRNNVAVSRNISRSYKHILVDEFQDTDSLQMDILRMIAGNSDTKLFTVGDPKQSIYRFRGADVTIFNTFFARVHVDFKTLRKNYRSSPALIRFVNHTFGRIMGQEEPEYLFEARYNDMKPHRKDDTDIPGIEVVVFEKEQADERRAQEADFIARRVLELKETYDYSYSDMALILRKGRQTRPFEEAFLSYNIPFVNLTSTDAFKSSEAYDIANLLGWLCEPNDPVLFSALLISPFFGVKPEDLHGIFRIAGRVEDVPKMFINDDELIHHPWLTGTDLERIRKILTSLISLRDRVTIREILEKAFEQTEYTLTVLADPVKGELSLSIVDHIIESADAFEGNGGGIREFARLLSRGMLTSEETPYVETKDDALNIITIHKAKGMEYKVVFLADITSNPRRDSKSLVLDKNLGIGFSMRDACGRNTRTLVGRFAGDNEKRKEIAESKRLFYVACTRAEDHLVISGGKPSGTPDPMYEKMNWMRWLHTALAISPDGDLSEETPKEMFVYRRIPDQDTSHGIASLDMWKALLEKAETSVSAKNPETACLIHSPENVSSYGKPVHLSPTQISDYLTCPALYLYKHTYGLKGEYSGGDGGFGAQYGLFAHRVLEKWDYFGQSDTESLVETTAGSDISHEWKDKLKDELSRFRSSPLYGHISRAEDVRREEPFAFVQDDVLIRGAMDVLYKTGDTFSIVDYKTDHITADEVQKTSERYRLQLGMYGVAAYRAKYQLPEKLVLHFLTPGISHETVCTNEFLEEVSSTVICVIEAMKAGDFEPRKSDDCETCPYKGLCIT